jgi:hypothetical protein
MHGIGYVYFCLLPTLCDSFRYVHVATYNNLLQKPKKVEHEGFVMEFMCLPCVYKVFSFSCLNFCSSKIKH